ncbi:MAG: hypothetical protein EPO36_11390 [Chloroflexota bacterium]|nr:MAG: hypothetical protein EPO36_11390 [Chloroflexota bacterium]
MTTDTVGKVAVGAVDDIERRPYPPGWLHWLLRRLDALPGPAWVAYIALGVIQSLLFHLQPWTLGRSAFGTLDTTNVYWGVILTMMLWVAAHLDRVAGSSLEASRPALSLADAEVARLRYELTVDPASWSAAALVGSAVLTILQFVVDPVGSNLVGLAAPLVVAAFVGQFVNVAILLVLLTRLVRQMRLIRVTLDRSAIIDPFLPGPLSAFSRLTARAGIALVVIVTSGIVITPQSPDLAKFLVTSAPYLVISPIIATLAFVVPLYGLHGRLEVEKDRLQAEVEVRLKGLLTELNRDVDARDLQRADDLNKTLASMLQQREVIARLPTWPWSTGTLRAIITAILLPIFLFVVQLSLARIL